MPSRAAPSWPSLIPKVCFTSGMRGAQLENTAPFTKKTSQRLTAVTTWDERCTAALRSP